jgi:hypothetical protein
MVYLLKMVIFHGYVSHNQMVAEELGYYNSLTKWDEPVSMQWTFIGKIWENV